MWREYPPTTPGQESPHQQQSVLPQQSLVPPPGVAWLPPIANDRTNFWGTAFLLLFLAFYIDLVGISAFLASHSPLFPRLGVLPFFLLFSGALTALAIKVNKQPQLWDRISLRRQRAAALGFAPDVPLAEPQPVPNVGALPLHSAIKHKMNWLALSAWACLMACLLLLSWIAFILPFTVWFGAPFQESLAKALHTWFAPLVWVLPALLNGVRWLLPQHLEVSPVGLAVKHPGFDWFKNGEQAKKQLICWQEARLFAIRGGNPYGSTMRYELSGPFTVITFDRILRPRWWSRFGPEQPFDEYNAQMEALLALISAHTGLLLYDVRKPE